MAQEIADSKLLDTWGSSGIKIEPDISKIIEGWQLGEQPPHEYMNWLQNTFGSKLNHILKNGIAEWNDETEYLAGASVQHSGNEWICETTNTNSEPTDLNANWERVAINKDLTITVDTLSDLRSISYPANTIWVSGYHTKNDGAFGSHIFRLKGVKTTETDNSGTVIIATIGGTDYVYELQFDRAVNVKWFGAVGDGVTDDTNAIQMVIDTIPDYTISTDALSNYGFSVFVPRGVYVLTNTVDIQNKIGLEIAGEGKHSTVFKDGSNGGIILFYINALGEQRNGKIIFQSLSIISDRYSQPNSAGLNINTAYAITIRDCYFYGFTKVNTGDSRETAGFFDSQDISNGNYGLRFNFSVSTLVDNTEFSWCGAGMVYDQFATVADTVAKVTNCYINYCGYGMYLFENAAPGLTVFGTTVEANYSPGIGIYNNENYINVIGCWFELNNNHIWMSRNSINNVNGSGFMCQDRLIHYLCLTIL